MAIRQLPDNPNFENLKKQAKSLLKSVKSGRQDALDRVGPYFGDPKSIGLQYAQLVIAREHGFSSWTKLKRHVESGKPPGELTGDQLANQFLDNVSVIYNQVEDLGPTRFARAADLLAEHPEIRTENIYTASAIGDVEQIDKWLEKDPGLINRKGGYFNWQPLMYAAYARLPGTSTLAAGLRLLERGADPNAHYMWGGQYKFTALTGVFGQGEGGPIDQPEHPDYIAFARAMLEAGADPNDSQAAYNRVFEPDDTCLELLIEYGLGAKDRNNWFEQDASGLVPNPEETMHYQLILAIRRGFSARAKLMIDNGVDVNKPDDTYDTLTRGKTPWQTAMLFGDLETADYLLANGASKTELGRLDEFHAVCMKADLERARQLLEADPRLIDDVEPRRSEILNDAAQTNNWPALEAMIALGFDISKPGERTPLHTAALSGHLDLVKNLVAVGADTKLRDPQFNGPAIGFAIHAKKTGVIAYLDTCEMDIFTAAARGRTDQLEKRLAEDPARLDQRFPAVRTGKTNRFATDWLTPLAVASTNNQFETTKMLLRLGADPKIDNGEGVPLLEVVKEHASPEMVELMETAFQS